MTRCLAEISPSRKKHAITKADPDNNNTQKPQADLCSNPLLLTLDCSVAYALEGPVEPGAGLDTASTVVVGLVVGKLVLKDKDIHRLQLVGAVEEALRSNLAGG
ncbi:hypothetical protein ASPBRDRAFT_33620 [Aspergillus brasiliensis CBS 101740]|uniref:Uncharacterized protein n=1 Tax=Aspergillus brasiliensis (strain CBS 101740 / IMI 381727 / IBT 21946) TaxID=767769 RepID=A0A1L9U9H8_ASPBC|nr:hypothetical protein ASPBRDRAFT_33620 [Aspergillus brasiliensis CBS 101740]